MLSDPRRFSRLVAAFSLIAAPLLVLAGMAATPWEDENTTAAYHDALAGHPDQAEIAAMLLHFGFLALLPASLGLMHLARGAMPKLAHVGGLLAIFGLATLPGLLVTDFYDLALAEALPRAQSVPISDATQESWAAAVLGLTAAFPTIIGMIVLAVAAWRAGAAPGWTALLVALGWLAPMAGPIGLAFSVAGAILLTIGLGWIGLKVARMDDQAWSERAFVRAKPKPEPAYA
ncbi:hypothetical protein DVA67_019360 [Solirubrobacter sp. CPCC 204708]|uniref:DUF4386 family protein n=1 Tax=Solirubrobacter deserti TaxID=2282478 RepID=A0ABT4RG23_9ACTN|nr:hypothetical protein [Solirubrobacter deserti]MBE2318149.1 hypothetical protein [Solirubrobacter deserti]MDA0137428.1 hypothetical protein [Solirubrobacter deserti]